MAARIVTRESESEREGALELLADLLVLKPLDHRNSCVFPANGSPSGVPVA